MRNCKKCGLEKPIDDFPTYRRLGSGELAWRWSCRRCFNSTRPSLAPEVRRKRNLKYKYGLSVEQFDALAANGCEICGTMEQLTVDHDHSCCPGAFTCGKCIRGILCDRHNRAEGFLNSNPAEALAMAEYMMKKVKVL